MQVFEARQRLLSELGWRENPFVKDLRVSDKESFLKYYLPLEGEKILERLAFDAKACLLVGPKGVGKTSALYFVKYSLPSEFESHVFKEPPQTLDGLHNRLFGEERGFLDSLLGRPAKKVSRENLVKKLRAKKKKVALFVDEAHLEENRGMYMEFKYLLDDVPNLRLVVSALGRDDFPDSLVHLIGEPNIFTRKKFSKEEMLKIISHRISAVGGKGLNPFPDVFLEEVLTEQNLLSPRYVFDELNSFLASLAMGKSDWKAASEYADNPIVQSVIRRDRITKGNVSWWNQLSPSQQNVMECLLGADSLTLKEIRKATGLSQNTAFNALYQLRGSDSAEKKRKPEVPFPLVSVKAKKVGGRKRNEYSLNKKVRNLFTMH
jgi:type II secretory pathway predicted ATPase ExeA